MRGDRAVRSYFLGSAFASVVAGGVVGFATGDPLATMLAMTIVWLLAAAAFGADDE